MTRMAGNIAVLILEAFLRLVSALTGFFIWLTLGAVEPAQRFKKWIDAKIRELSQ